jgi:AcrR family transcriptional regulator
VDDIVLKAEVAKGSFYNHFADKDDLAREITLLVRHEVEGQVTAANANVTDPCARMARAVSVFIRFALTDRERAQVFSRLLRGATLADAPSNAGLRYDLELGLTEGAFTDVTVAAAVPFVMGVVQSTMSLALEEKRPVHFAREVESIVRALLRGLGVPQPRAATTAHAAVTDIIGEIAP